LPGDHASTFTALTGTTRQEAAATAHPATPYLSLLEIDDAVDELLVAALVLVVAAIPLRRGARWAWWACWLIVLPEAAFAGLFGAHAAANLAVAGGVAAVAVVALLLLRPHGAQATQETRARCS
jgi:hypothetical protein